MKPMNTIKLICLAVCMGLSGFAAADLTGSWTVTVETEMGSGTPTFDLKEEDGKISGTYNGQMGSLPVTGSVDSNNFQLVISVEAQGMAMDIKYTGTVDGDAIEGKMAMGEFGGGTFTGKKQ